MKHRTLLFGLGGVLVLVAAGVAGAILAGGLSGPDRTPPAIDVWYGTHQTFGRRGTPQRWINVMGTVTDAGDVVALTYAVNDAPGSASLSIGPDGRRLLAPGDFNIELDTEALVEGLNTVTITATDAAGNSRAQTVTVDYHPGRVWPLPYAVDWETVASATDVVQIVDGRWSWDEAGIRTRQVGYDRLLALGDVTWEDYEVTIAVTVHDTDEWAYLSRKSSGPGLGIIMRWTGHSNEPISCEQPRCGWRPSGGSNWYEWRLFRPDRLHIFASPPQGSAFTETVRVRACRHHLPDEGPRGNPAGRKPVSPESLGGRA